MLWPVFLFLFLYFSFFIFSAKFPIFPGFGGESAFGENLSLHIINRGEDILEREADTYDTARFTKQHQG